jgi:hypothetical protein
MHKFSRPGSVVLNLSYDSNKEYTILAHHHNLVSYGPPPKPARKWMLKSLFTDRAARWFVEGKYVGRQDMPTVRWDAAEDAIVITTKYGAVGPVVCADQGPALSVNSSPECRFVLSWEHPERCRGSLCYQDMPGITYVVKSEDEHYCTLRSGDCKYVISARHVDLQVSYKKGYSGIMYELCCEKHIVPDYTFTIAK